MENRNNEHSAWTSIQMRLTDQISTYGQVVMTEASSGFTGLNLDPAKVSAIPAGFDYRAVSDLGNYSRLRMRWWNTEVGVRQMLGKSFQFDSALTYDRYRDSQPYLEDYSGKHWGAQFRVHYFF